MSFSLQVKREICAQHFDGPCCTTAACYGLACFARRFDRGGLKLSTESAFIAQWAKQVFGEAGIDGKVFVRGKTGGYEYAVTNAFEVEKVFALLGHSSDETQLRIHTDNFLCDGCLRAFVAAAFLAGGTMVNPEKGYALEFVTARHGVAADFAALLGANGMEPRLAARSGTNVVYFRASEQIEDLLTLMGAQKATLEIIGRKVYKDHRNRANRITNCETANIDKAVAASKDVLLAIQRLEAAGAMASLPEGVQQAAVLRKAHPDLTLAELVELSGNTVSKPGLSHRFAKIKEKAKELGGAKDAD